MNRRCLSVLLAAAALGGCSTIAHGSRQTIALATSPPGARCGVYRHGDLIGEVGATPGGVTVTRERQELTVLCVKPGHRSATAFLRNDRATDRLADVGNFMLGAGPGWAIDAATDASLRYDDPLTLTLQPGTAGRADLPGALRVDDRTEARP